MKWGVGRVIYEATKREDSNKNVFANGINNGKLIILPYYHLNMEKVLPEAEDLHVISIIPGKDVNVYCKVEFGFVFDVVWGAY